MAFVQTYVVPSQSNVSVDQYGTYLYPPPTYPPPGRFPNEASPERITYDYNGYNGYLGGPQVNFHHVRDSGSLTHFSQNQLTRLRLRVDGALILSHILYHTTMQRVHPPAADSTHPHPNTQIFHNRRPACTAKHQSSSLQKDPIVRTGENPATRITLHTLSPPSQSSSWPPLALQITFLYPSPNLPNLFPRGRLFTGIPKSHFR
jgi:hypothetical protein